MSTNDVPGYNPKNSDALAMGCWAEHVDGSLIFVESTEANRVIYSLFDISKNPPIEYRDAMPEDNFKKNFSWDDNNKKFDKWTWHDKTAFPWDRVIKAGVPDGGRFAMAEHQMSAAERVADSLKLYGARVSSDIRHRGDRTVEKSRTIWDRLSRAVAEFGKR